MNIKRAILFGVFFWVVAFVAISIFMFAPWLKESETRQYVAWFIFEVPLTLLLAKWYFKQDAPTVKKGLLLGLIGIVVGTILDMIITIPLFVSTQFDHPYVEFYSEWKLYLGLVIALVLTTFAGYEFDATYTKQDVLSEGGSGKREE